MKNKVKRTLSIVVVIIMVICVVPVGLIAEARTDMGSANGSDYTSSAALASKLNEVFSGSIGLYTNSSCSTSVNWKLGTAVANNSYYVKPGLTGMQCYIYGQAVYGYLFGGDRPYHGGGDFTSHSRVVMSNVSVSSGSSLYQLFVNNGVKIGAYIRSTDKSDGSYNGSVGHSAIILSYDSSYITVLHANIDGKNTAYVSKYTWNDYANSRFINSGRKISHIVQPTDEYYKNTYGITDASNYADIGTNFTAPILNKEHWKIIETDINDNGYIKTADEKGIARQLWKFERQLDGSYKITSCENGRCLDVYNSGTADGTIVGTCESNNSDAQRWYIYEKNGGYVLCPKCAPNSALDLNNNDPTNGTQIQLWTKNDTGAQVWAIYKGDECKLNATTLSVTAGKSGTKTVFKWNDVYGESRYDVKIWKNKLYEGDAYHIEWGASSGYGIQLPAGTYQAYVDACNYYDCFMSNTVTFTVTNSTYTIAFNANGGSGTMSNLSCTYNASKTLTANAFTRTGYVFTGWNTKADGSGTAYADKASVKNLATSGTVTLYAQWKANTYTVAFNANGGTGTMSNSSHVYNTAKNLTANAFTRDGYLFTGWNTKADGSGTAYADNASVKNLTSTNGGTVTLYAQWVLAYYIDLNCTVDGTYNGKLSGYGKADVYINGTLVSVGATDFFIQYPNGTEYEVKNIVADTGYRYVGASTVSGTVNNGKAKILLAFEKIKYSVTYNANGGSGVPGNETKTYDVNLTLSSTKPTRTGYTFTGWNTKADGSGTAFAAGASYTSNAVLTLYAQWKANTYTIAFNANGGSGTMSNLTCTYDVAKTLTANAFTKTGYTFNGWNTKADGSGTAYANSASVKNLTSTSGATVTLYAQWKANTYTIAFNANGGSGTMSNLTCTYDASKTLTANAFTRTGYAFNGWNTKADGSGTAYADKASVKNLAASGTVTLYAQWKANTYTIAFTANGGSGTMSNLSCTYDASKTLTANAFTKTGYTYNGWNTKADGSGNAYADKASVKNLAASGTVTLYAQWKANTYTIAFNANGGSGTMSKLSCTYDVAKTLTANAFTRTGYTFNGWNTKADGSGNAYADKASVKNLTSINGETVTLYAQWEESILPADKEIFRMAGKGREETAAQISEKTYSTAENVIIACGDDYADALAGVPLAYLLDAPILLVRKSGLESNTLNEITRLGAKNIYILGGSFAVSDEVENTFKGNGYHVERIFGNDRFGTAVEIAKKMENITGKKPSTIFFAYSHNYPDALAVSGVAAVLNAPILYIAGTGIPETATQTYLSNCKAEIFMIGGTGIISTDAEIKLKMYDTNSTVERVSGNNRYDTCVAINERFADIFSGETLCVATGTNFPDALAGGVFCAVERAPLLLVGANVSDVRMDYIKNYDPQKIFIFGGTGVVSQEIEDAIFAAVKE